MIQIKYRYSDKILFEADLKTLKEVLEYALKQGADLRGADLRGADLGGANLGGADLRYADLGGANLGGADLRGADLGGADLGGANLRYANLRGANLRGADLGDADLRYAKGINKYVTTPMYLLLEQSVIRSYKMVNNKKEGIYRGGIRYEIGQTYEVTDADTNENESCGAGINLASLDWCIKEWNKGFRILIVEHKREDIAAIPIGSDGKYRVHRCKVIGEKDLKEIGLVNDES